MYRALPAALAISLLMFTTGQSAAETLTLPEVVQEENLNVPAVTSEENMAAPEAPTEQPPNVDPEAPAEQTPNIDPEAPAEQTPNVAPEATPENAATAPQPTQAKNFSVTLPGRGMTMEQVEARFGTAKQKNGPVGTPPITTWVYDKFTVYFEGHYVIHAVFDKPN